MRGIKPSFYGFSLDIDFEKPEEQWKLGQKSIYTNWNQLNRTFFYKNTLFLDKIHCREPENYCESQKSLTEGYTKTRQTAIFNKG